MPPPDDGSGASAAVSPAHERHPDDQCPLTDPPARYPADAELAAAVIEGPVTNLVRWFRFLGVRPGEHVELQALDVPQPRSSYRPNYFAHASSADEFIKLCGEGEKMGAPAVYVLLNEIDPAVATRAPAGNWHQQKKGESTTDANVQARRVLFVDIDPERPSGTSSTDDQTNEAHAVGKAIADQFSVLLGTNDPILRGHSGNGASVMVALDYIPCTPEVTSTIKDILTALGALHGTERIKIDQSVSDPKRLAPAFGTMKRKGAPDVPERPHRRSACVCSPPARRISISELTRLRDELAELAQVARPSAPSASRTVGGGRKKKQDGARSKRKKQIESASDSPWSRANELDPREVCTWLGVLDGDTVRCPGCGETSGVDAIDHGVKCHHDRCADKGRNGFRTNIDLTMEVHGVEARQAYALLAEHFELAPILEGVTSDCTDLRNAERLVEWFGEDLRYCSTWAKWLAWDGTRWQLDDQCRAHAFAKEAARRLLALALDRQRDASEELAEATARNDDDAIGRTKKALARANRDVSHAIGSQNAKQIGAMLSVAKSDRAMVVRHDALDADPWLLNVANGTIELRTGRLREHRREDLITKLAPVDYDPDATAPTWLAFLERAMGGVLGLVEFLARLIGYSLTGEVREHIVAFFFGAGRNGKSTFLGIIHSMLGDYATPAPRQLLFRSRGDRHPTELASLHCRRFVTCSEIEEGLSWDEALVKDLTGGDPIECRRMREDFWTYEPSHKLFIAGNHKPQVRGDDEGIWRRMRLVPWTVTIPENEQDTELPDKLRKELPGILAWAVRGCLDWQRHGLRAPDEVRNATDTYRSENDVLGQFFRLYVVFEPGARVSRKVLRETYETFCKDNGFEPLGAKRFTGRLREQGVTGTTMRVGVHTPRPLFIQAGQYEGKAIRGRVQQGETSNGTLQLAIDMEIFDAQNQSLGEMTTFLYFTVDSAKYSYERLRLLGWKGTGPEDIDKLNDIFENKVPVRVTAPESYQAPDGTLRLGKSKLEIQTSGVRPFRGVVDAWRGVRLATEDEHEAGVGDGRRRDVGTCMFDSPVTPPQGIPTFEINREVLPTSPYVPTTAPTPNATGGAGQAAPQDERRIDELLFGIVNGEPNGVSLNVLCVEMNIAGHHGQRAVFDSIDRLVLEGRIFIDAQKNVSRMP